MYLARVPLIFKIAMRASFGEITSKVVCDFVENSIILSFGYVSKRSSSRDFEKIPFNQSCKLIAYMNTTKTPNQIL